MIHARTLFGMITTAALATVAPACGADADPSEEPEGESTSEAMSSKVAPSYGVTTFGGPGDYQPLACGGNSRTAGPWYVASSQRYGCNKHLKLEGNGRCVVVRTADAGPASFVESKAGIAVMDASPSVTKHLFGVTSLGWSDIKAHPTKYRVKATVTTLPLGPC